MQWLCKTTDQFKSSYLVVRLNISSLSSPQIYHAHQGLFGTLSHKILSCLQSADVRCGLTYSMQLLIFNNFSNQDLEKVCQFSRNIMSLQSTQSNVTFSKTKCCCTMRNTPPNTDKKKGITLNKIVCNQLIFSRVLVIVDGVWIGEYIYWTLTSRNYK
jgi:hypothetical protein